MAMLRKLKKLLNSIKRDFNLKFEEYGRKGILFNDEMLYYVYFYRQKRNLGPSHLKSLINFVEEEIKRIKKDKKNVKKIIILSMKLTENSKKIVRDVIKGKNIFILELPTMEKYYENEDKLFERLVSEISKIKL